MYCTKCGKELIEGKCPDCDIAAVAGSRQEKPIEQKAKKRSKKEKKPKEKKIKEKTPKEKKPLSKKAKVIIIVSVAAFLVVAAAAAVLAVYFVTDAKYNDAIALLNDDNPEDAAEVFEELEDFKEAPAYLQDCNTLMDYYEAKNTLEDGEYEDAISLFDELGNYEDSDDLQRFAQQNFDFEAANLLYDSGAIEQAKAAYLALGDFENSIEMVETCQIELDYAEAASLFAVGQFQGALNIFETIPDYLDSKDKIFICDCKLSYEYALEMLDDGYNEAATKLLHTLEYRIDESYIDFADIVPFNELKYNQGLAYFRQDLFYSAYEAFQTAGGVFDATEMAESCKQPIETEEIYVNPDYTSNSVSITFYAAKESGRSICIKIYSEEGDLASVILVAANKKLRIKLPRGTYSFNVGTGIDWFGEKEAFGDDARYYTMVMDKEGGTTWRLKSTYIYTIKFEVSSGDGYGGITMNPGDF